MSVASRLLLAAAWFAAILGATFGGQSAPSREPLPDDSTAAELDQSQWSVLTSAQDKLPAKQAMAQTLDSVSKGSENAGLSEHSRPIGRRLRNVKNSLHVADRHPRGRPLPPYLFDLDLAAMLPRLSWTALCTVPMSSRLLAHVHVHRPLESY